MNVTHKIKICLDDRLLLQPIDVVQGDAYTRRLEFTLYAGGEEWPVPEGVTPYVTYRGSGGSGIYSDLDGEPAYEVSGNVITVTLIPQAVAAPGTTVVNIMLRDEDGKQLSTFSVLLRVAFNPGIGAGEPKDYFDIRQWVGAGPLYVTLVPKEGIVWTASHTHAQIKEAYDAGRDVLCILDNKGKSVVPLIYITSSLSTFQGPIYSYEDKQIKECTVNFASVLGNEAQVKNAEYLSQSDLEGYVRQEDLKPPLYVADTGISVDTFAAIKDAYDGGRAVYCVNTGASGSVVLPLVAITGSSAVFQVENKVNYTRIVIKSDGSKTSSVGTYATEDDLSAYALARNVTGESYFDITEDGVVSLKPEYRGVCMAGVPDTMASDNGVGAVGTRYNLLPEEIIIPEAVNGIAVTALSSGMFFGNKRIKYLEIPAYIEKIPSHFCRDAWNLVQIKGTESVKTLGSYAFYATGILEASFPALESWGTNSKLHFNRCANLVTIDLGDNITAIPEGCFQACEKLTEVRGASKVTVIGPYSFYITQRLKTLPFLAQLTEIGDCSLLISRVHLTDENGGDIIPADCTLGKFATAKQFCGPDYWSACQPTACNTPLRSTFNQDDPRWGHKTFGNFKREWGKGCGTVCAAMIYSVFENKDLYSPEEFAEAVYAKAPELMDVDPGTAEDGLQRYLEAVGYQVTKYPEFNTESLQAMYDALAAGALVIHRCLSGAAQSGNQWIAGAHDVLIHGVNTDGEVLVADPAAQGKLIGQYDVNHHAMPIQNRSRAGEIQDVDGDGEIDQEDISLWKDWFWIVKK